MIRVTQVSNNRILITLDKGAVLDVNADESGLLIQLYEKYLAERRRTKERAYLVPVVTQGNPRSVRLEVEVISEGDGKLFESEEEDKRGKRM